MAYKVICTECEKPVKIQISKNGRSFILGCQCEKVMPETNRLVSWKIQESGVIPQSDRQRYCSGCEDNFYNGNNSVGVIECWNLKSAKVVEKKKVGINDEPPWNHTPIKCLSCFHQKGYVMVNTKATY